MLSTTRLLGQSFFLNVMASYWRCARQLPVAVTRTCNNQLSKGRDLDLVVSVRHGYLGTCHVDQAGLALLVMPLPLLPKCCDYRCAPPCPAKEESIGSLFQRLQTTYYGSVW